MGDVYRAKDTRLDRMVAIKVLPADFAADPQSRARFDREARAISQLTHPHICTLYDVGDEGGTPYLVMELLQGQTLAERLTKGALPLDEALTIAIDIADALSAAHKRGIVHRDLKPLNVMLTKTGAKLLDFGLAKAAAPAVAMSADSTQATAATAHLTSKGTILGTLHYMAPEQVEGREADTRSDLWAFGAVLYEMLTGQQAFTGESSAAVVGSILKDRPLPLSARVPAVSASLDQLVARCLEKEPDDRWQNAADLRAALRWAAEAPSAVPITPPQGRSGGMLVAAVAVLAFGLAGGMVVWRSTPGVAIPAPLPMQFEVLPPAGALWSPAPVSSTAQVAISPDGRRLALVAARSGGVAQVWLRAVDRVSAEPLSGTEGAAFPFWSPDSRSIGFFADGKLKTIDAAGGPAQALADAPSARGGSWGPNGTIIFSPAQNSRIMRVPVGGGVATPVTRAPDAQALADLWPHFLPDGDHFLYYHNNSNSSATPQGIYAGSLTSLLSVPVHSGSSMGVYSEGRLLFARDSMLFAQTFDAATLETRGEAVRIADRVGYFSPSFGFMAVAVSPTGVLVTGPSVAMTTELRWFDRAGRPTSAASAPAVHSSPRLSRDQRSVAVSIHDTTTAQRDIWVLDAARWVASRATFDPGNDWFPAWSSDSARLLFGSARSGANTAVYQKDGAGQDQAFAPDQMKSATSAYPNDVSSDGRFMVFTRSGLSGYDLRVVAMSGHEPPATFLATPFNEVGARFAPDGKWLAYSSDESGRFEVYVRPFPSSNRQWKVSVAGGQQPEWRRDGKELFYVAPDHALMAVPVTLQGDVFAAGDPHALFGVITPEVSAPFPSEYAVTADGQHFLVNSVVEQANRQTLTVMLNWVHALEGTAGVTPRRR